MVKTDYNNSLKFAIKKKACRELSFVVDADWSKLKMCINPFLFLTVMDLDAGKSRFMMWLDMADANAVTT